MPGRSAGSMLEGDIDPGGRPGPFVTGILRNSAVHTSRRWVVAAVVAITIGAAGLLVGSTALSAVDVHGAPKEG